MTNDNARPLSRKANTLDLEALLLLGHLHGFLQTVTSSAPDCQAKLLADLEAYVYADSVPPIDPKTLQKILGGEDEPPRS